MAHLRLFSILALLCFPLTLGCGGSGVAEPTTDKDELATYLEENPDVAQESDENEIDDGIE